ncbi:YwqI/YxiC family protein [Salicibibacter cibarius]|uniref:YwqI/YxiC family protein n=1 Tax=Salicibibacter cibarius TaxID=2743000 RepID=A0A7T6Z6H8_9BACI|nr:DUF5344 family protein [Salicibibacter cibarius]QQK77577.1 YwqI/YxiC family protein [Salicibibacter cibarius]
MNEIKVTYGSVEHGLTTISAGANQLNANYSSSVGQNNVLNMVDELNEMCALANDLTNSYRALLTSNVQTTQSHISTLKQTDTSLASSMN